MTNETPRAPDFASDSLEAVRYTARTLSNVNELSARRHVISDLLRSANEQKRPWSFINRLAITAAYLDLSNEMTGNGPTRHLKDLEVLLNGWAVPSQTSATRVSSPVVQRMTAIVAETFTPSGPIGDALEASINSRGRSAEWHLKHLCHDFDAANAPEHILGAVGVLLAQQAVNQMVARVDRSLDQLLGLTDGGQSIPTSHWMKLLSPHGEIDVDSAMTLSFELQGALVQTFRNLYGEYDKDARLAHESLTFLKTSVLPDGQVGVVRTGLISKIASHQWTDIRETLQQLEHDHPGVLPEATRLQYGFARVIDMRRFTPVPAEWEVKKFWSEARGRVYFDTRKGLVIRIPLSKEEYDRGLRTRANTLIHPAVGFAEPRLAIEGNPGHQRVVAIDKWRKTTLSGRQFLRGIRAGEIVPVFMETESGLTIDVERLSRSMVEQGLSRTGEFAELAKAAGDANAAWERRQRSIEVSRVHKAAERVRQADAPARELRAQLLRAAADRELRSAPIISRMLAGHLVVVAEPGRAPSVFWLKDANSIFSSDPQHSIATVRYRHEASDNPGRGFAETVNISAGELHLQARSGWVKDLGRAIVWPNASHPSKGFEFQDDARGWNLKVDETLAALRMQERQVSKYALEQYGGHVVVIQTARREFAVGYIVPAVDESKFQAERGKSVPQLVDGVRRLELPSPRFGTLKVVLQGSDRFSRVDARLFHDAHHSVVRDMGTLPVGDEGIPHWDDWRVAVGEAVQSMQRATMSRQVPAMDHSFG